MEVIELLKKEYPSKQILLHYTNPLELLIATMLAAQCTDKRVNIVTQELFKRYPTVKEFAEANISELEQYIYSTGFYHNKAKNIILTSKMIQDKFNGEVPSTMEELIQLPGVARKTANIVLFNSFNKVEGIAVDTHVARLSNRLGLTKNKNPKKIEKDLMLIIPQKDWGLSNHLLVDHGRSVCTARNPLCSKCVLDKYCPSKIKEV